MASEAGHAPNRQYEDQSGNVHLNGANLLDKGELAVAQQVGITPAAGAANVCNVTLQVKDGAGNSLPGPFELLVYLSDSSVGNGLTAVTASGTVGQGSAGTDLSAKVAKKAIDVLTDNTGKYVLSITDTAKTGFYVVVICPGTGNPQIGAQLVAGNYG